MLTYSADIPSNTVLGTLLFNEPHITSFITPNPTIVIGNHTEICNGTLGLANNNLMFHGCNDDESKKCGLCGYSINTGVEWRRDEDTKLIMCFDCIFDSILKIEAKESWDNLTGNYDNSKDIHTSSNDIKKLQDKVSELERKIEMLLSHSNLKL